MKTYISCSNGYRFILEAGQSIDAAYKAQNVGAIITRQAWRDLASGKVKEAESKGYHWQASCSLLQSALAKPKQERQQDKAKLVQWARYSKATTVTDRPKETKQRNRKPMLVLIRPTQAAFDSVNQTSGSVRDYLQALCEEQSARGIEASALAGKLGWSRDMVLIYNASQAKRGFVSVRKVSNTVHGKKNGLL